MKNYNIRRILLAVYDIGCVFLCSYLALILVFYNEWQIQSTNWQTYSNNVLIYSSICAALTIIIFYIFKLYSSLWKYAGLEEVIKIFMATLCIYVINMIVSLLTQRFVTIRWCLTFSILQFLFVVSGRFIFRVIKYYKSGNRIIKKQNYGASERVMIIGAGDAGLAIIKEMRNSEKVSGVPVCLIDDNPEKMNMFLEGVKVVGNRDDIPRIASFYQIDKIIIAMPSISAVELAKIIMICQDSKCKIQTVPGIYQMISGGGFLSEVRDVQVEDLLGRDPITVNNDEITGYLKDKVVLVTGGGGSIGSELCRQICKAQPQKLIILDCYENNAYDIEQELKRKYKELNLLVLIASVRDKRKIEDVFEKNHPDIVFHAAAHKHVPLMETSPNEAIKNNVFGTLNVAEASSKYGVKKFVMISTDKAVNPTNIMGASKRICEMIVQTLNKKSKTEFVATRFGNVLGSNGSVIPLFQKQIQNGGPVTVTHKDIIRYFMTISEAVSLVLQAGSYAKGGEIFVLDMGKPVRIYDLAVNLIKLNGYTPNVDMQIKITGLRPGEKLYEEMLMKEEGLQETPNKLIYIGHQIDVNEDELMNDLAELNEAAHNETDHMKYLVKKLVPTYVIE